ncbi:hypothetical protein GF391_03805|nr:hypothetical protein [Candidatus Uhrbacteria bacterium]
MQKSYLYLLGGLAIIISVLAVATLSYAGGSKIRIPLVTSGLETIMENLNPPGPENLTAPTDDLEVLVGDAFEPQAEEEKAEKATTPTAWKNFSFNGYSFEIPTDWETAWPSVEQGYTTILFKDADDKVVGEIVSPPPVTGYETWQFETKERVVTKDGERFKLSLMLGSVVEDYADGSNGGSLNMVFAQKADTENMDDSLFNPARGIQFLSNAEGTDKIFERIYKSLAPETPWQTFSGDHFRFQYPENWTVVSEGGAGSRWVEFYDETNQLAAFMKCPIPETGYEGYEMSEAHRTLSRAGMKYALDYWHGEAVDDRGDLELIMMEMMTPPEGMEGGFGGSTCALTAEQADMTEIFERIHQSVTVRNASRYESL